MPCLNVFSQWDPRAEVLNSLCSQKECERGCGCQCEREEEGWRVGAGDTLILQCLVAKDPNIYNMALIMGNSCNSVQNLTDQLPGSMWEAIASSVVNLSYIWACCFMRTDTSSIWSRYRGLGCANSVQLLVRLQQAILQPGASYACEVWAPSSACIGPLRGPE